MLLVINWFLFQPDKNSKNTYHSPFIEKKCYFCHEGNRNKVKNFLAIECLKCHPREVKNYERPKLHSPFKYGQCLVCHLPHNSSYNSLLKGPETEICYRCHSDVKPENFRFSHKVNKCTYCHLYHSSERSKFLLADPVRLCTQPCHSEAELSQNHPVGFGVIDPNTQSSLTCTSSCHAPHGSNFKGLLKTNSRNLCFSCHNY